MKNVISKGFFLILWIVATTSFLYILVFDGYGTHQVQGHRLLLSLQQTLRNFGGAQVDEPKEVQSHYGIQVTDNESQNPTIATNRPTAQSFETEPYQSEFNRTRTWLKQMRRQEHLTRICKDYYNISPLNTVQNSSLLLDVLDTRLHWTYFNDDYKMMLSFIYKVGSSNWRRVFQTLHEKSSENFTLLQKDQAWTLIAPHFEKSPPELIRRLSNFTKIIFVRHPLARVLSAYKDKFVNLPTAWYRKKARLILEIERGTKFGGRLKPNVTFTEFIDFITNEKLGELSRDNHWSAIFDRYRPCDNYFDFIGHLETLNEDVDYLFNLLNIHDIVTYAHSKNPTYSSSRVSIQTHFGQLSDELFRKLLLKYEDDFRVFGYRMPRNVSDIAF